MADGLPPFWRPQGFREAVAAWIAVDHPSRDVYDLVTNWLLDRLDTPHDGVRRDTHRPDLFQGRVPGTETGDDRAVYCTYEIREFDRLVVCHNIAYLSEPVTCRMACSYAALRLSRRTCSAVRFAAIESRQVVAAAVMRPPTRVPKRPMTAAPTLLICPSRVRLLEDR